ncbi:phosphorylase superfamily protein [Krasilnikovia cinnamomea]|uniref:Uridine phosphorylase n=1 Tax=Krasilnikovia cinnamomea TaxID=349313 RepID=A0A4Q7ZKX7_9ACTN|nr:nucleoside phosphorylase [Krasilnikovia cinnamomea]RZU50849.1 phosphorylase superfamily protein [Krasilnikovia cinnamomea]
MEQTGQQRHFHIPLTEHDSARQAFIEPSETISPRDVPGACVITFFGDVVDRLVERRGARVLVENRWEDGPHPLLEVEHLGERLAVLRSGVGAPLAGALLEEVIAMGCRAFVVCGGAGALHSELTLGHFVVVSAAIRDEGTSYHYLPAARSIQFDEAARSVLEEVLKTRGAPFVVGQTWTTDAPYRETPGKIAHRRAEGCLTVEMEAAALAAVARFRGVPLAQVVYCGDDLAGDSWDHRSWQNLSDVREDLFDLAASAAIALSRASA